ncbi:MAG TPA: DUF4394 domain-containing protein [Gemmatimonadales bacterium]|nr:DUF4394 domain-containing protein [Gemmatimonadales bacterium]
MDQILTRRRIRAAALAFLTLTAALTAACGGDSGGGLTDPPSDPSDPTDPGPDDPGGPQGPAPVGTVMYAVDLSNNFLVFGSGSVGTLSAKMRITGLPILKRVIGLAIRPSDGAVIGVGNDSRVYTIDPLTAEATPVSDSPFAPQIASFFDIHFAMAVEPNGQRVRLVAAESGGNWSIDMNTGTATLGAGAEYGAGSELEGHTPRLLGLVYPTLPDSAKQAGWCANLAYAVDADEATVIASCDPETGWWYPTGRSPEPSTAIAATGVRLQASATATVPKELEELRDQLLRCGEFMNTPSGSTSEGEQEPPAESGPWFPRSPDTEFWVFLNKVGELQNRAGTVKLIDGQKWGLTLNSEVPSAPLIQSGVWAVGGPYGPSQASAGRPRVRPEIQLSSAESEAASDPWAACTSGS